MLLIVEGSDPSGQVVGPACALTITADEASRARIVDFESMMKVIELGLRIDTSAENWKLKALEVRDE